MNSFEWRSFAFLSPNLKVNQEVNSNQSSEIDLVYYASTLMNTNDDILHSSSNYNWTSTLPS